MTDVLASSWSAFSPEIAKVYLDGYGFPSTRSKELLADFLTENSNGRTLTLLDLGCGNGQLLKYFRQRALSCRYVGVDFSTSLLAAAREQFAGDGEAEFVEDDAEKLGAVTGKFDFAIYSHVLEILACPEASLRRASEMARQVIVRFFEPPEFDQDTVELRQMDVGDGRSVPYLRRKMSRDYYRLILSRCNCKRVEVYQADGDKDQIHVLSF